MKDDTRAWVNYALDNIAAAKLLVQQSLYNPCLQNVQQAIEKILKALLLEKAHELRKTHSITELIRLLANYQVVINISEDECDLLDSIYLPSNYLPSKYPLGGVLPDFEPDELLCRDCLDLAERVVHQAEKMLES